MSADAARFDVVGDIHGELPALQALGRELGYDVANGWTHPDGRVLLFLGDLVDRGAYSLQVAELVMGLVRQRRALCIMGNHEYNLVAWHLGVPGYGKAKSSNQDTIAAIQAQPSAWTEVLGFFRTLPVALALPDLRVIHAVWHLPSLAVVEPVLRSTGRAQADDAVGWLERHVVLETPFAERGLRPGLPDDLSDEDADIAHENLMKGFEVPASEPFKDNDGHERRLIRAVWWRDQRDAVLCDKTQVFGHYWNVPPIDGNFAPPFPSGHPQLREWGRSLAARCPERGRVALAGDYACVDFNGFTKADGKRACVGALRWPEREVAWAMAPRSF